MFMYLHGSVSLHVQIPPLRSVFMYSETVHLPVCSVFICVCAHTEA